MRELWDKPLSSSSSAAAVAASSTPASAAAPWRKHFENSHHWRMMRLLGDPGSKTPPSAAHVFCSCGFIEGIFLCVNAVTFSPFLFEIAMPYHLKYTALVISWWGGVYWGLNVVQYGPLAGGLGTAVRTAAGLVLVACGVSALILADGTSLGPWPSYWVLIGAYSAMAAFDVGLHRKQLIPVWLLKWKLGLSTVIVLSLVFGVLKGKWLERNARQLIMDASDLE